MLTYAADVEGHHVHIDDDPSSRGPFTCIVCGVTLIAKRGLVMAHHFAHDPGADCVAAGGEGALHLSAKLGLQRVLRTRAQANDTLLVNVSCPCPQTYAVELLRLTVGDEVEVEVTRDQLRPDLVITRAGKDVLVVEVVDTHACPPEKWEALRAGTCPVLEVPVEGLVAEDGAFIWDPTTPLPHEGRVLHLPPPTCGECQQRAREAREARERAEAQEREWERREQEERRRPRTTVLSALVCYQYFANGRREKHQIAVLLDYESDALARARMALKGGRQVASWEQPVAADRDALRRAVQAAFREWKTRQEREHTVTMERHWCSDFEEKPVSVEHAFRLHDPPQDLWWDRRHRKWVRAYTMIHLEDVFPWAKKHTLFNWRDSRFKLSPLQAFEGAKETLVMDADEVDRFAKWLKEKKKQQAAFPAYSPLKAN